VKHSPSGQPAVAHLQLIIDNPPSRMHFSGHVIGLLKEYMRDLVEQARQEATAHEAFGFAAVPYSPDQAVSDLLAILDDRIESEGVQVGLPQEFLHDMWTVCDRAQTFIKDQVWLEQNVGQVISKALTRERTYLALIAFIEREGGQSDLGV